MLREKLDYVPALHNEYVPDSWYYAQSVSRSFADNQISNQKPTNMKSMICLSNNVYVSKFLVMKLVPYSNLMHYLFNLRVLTHSR